MTIRTTLFCAGAALALSACGSSDKPAATETAGAEATPTEALAAATPAAPAKSAAPSREFMVGKWAEKGECKLAIGFNADGTMDGPYARWELADGVLTMVGNPQKMTLTVVDKDTMESRRSSTDAPRRLQRC